MVLSDWTKYFHVPYVQAATFNGIVNIVRNDTLMNILGEHKFKQFYNSYIENDNRYYGVY